MAEGMMNDPNTPMGGQPPMSMGGEPPMGNPMGAEAPPSPEGLGAPTMDRPPMTA